MKLIQNLTKALIKVTFICIVAFSAHTLEKPIVISLAAPYIHKIIIPNDSQGTGYHLVHKGLIYLVTNKHVCSKMITKYIDMEMFDGNQKRNFKIPYTLLEEVEYIYVDGIKLKVLATSDKSDLCLIEPFLNSGFSLGIDTGGLPVYTAGYPGNRGITVVKAMPTGSRCIRVPFLNVDCAIAKEVDTPTHPGSSGSPVFNIFGGVIGTVFYNTINQSALYIPSSELIKFIEEYESK